MTASLGTPIGLVIFDCDGVLVDSERIAVRVQRHVLGSLGWAITDDEIIERFIGRSADAIRAAVDARLGDGTGERWHQAFHRLHRQEVDTGGLPLIDGIADALDAILPAYATCVASGGSHVKMRHTLGVTGLYARFEGRIFSSAEVPLGKPAPDIFLHAAVRMGVDPATCVVVEDSAYGVQAARAAGMRAFAYAGGLTPVDRLTGPDTVVFDDMRALPELLGLPGPR
ncbi:HAD family phosphatase [Yinghuangia sp. ASG 101]|uniref:HAD family hydrolase n=1 Tax=Yinghuangia sp. ASG 101 TaxID=2896848 RepID=UPI001E3807FA|nr:HAD family phosphatase [Yinghuangia sp. ASG 101]UGQ12894.1 HAD family phosphatase [Yinghuangia sp. ASG 101]